MVKKKEKNEKTLYKIILISALMLMPFGIYLIFEFISNYKNI